MRTQNMQEKVNPSLLSQTIYISISVFSFNLLVKPLHLKVLDRRIARMQLWWAIKTDGMACCVGGMCSARSLLTFPHDIRFIRACSPRSSRYKTRAWVDGGTVRTAGRIFRDVRHALFHHHLVVDGVAAGAAEEAVAVVRSRCRGCVGGSAGETARPDVAGGRMPGIPRSVCVV
jgi:hypothetical protein